MVDSFNHIFCEAVDERLDISLDVHAIVLDQWGQVHSE